MAQKNRIQILSVRKIDERELKTKEELKQTHQHNYLNAIKLNSANYHQNISKYNPNKNINLQTHNHGPSSDYFSSTQKNSSSIRSNHHMAAQQSSQNKFKTSTNQQFQNSTNPSKRQQDIKFANIVEVQISKLLQFLDHIQKGSFTQSLGILNESCQKHPSIIRKLAQTQSKLKQQEALYRSLRTDVIGKDFLAQSGIWETHFQFFTQLPQIFYQIAQNLVKTLQLNCKQISSKTNIKKNFQFISKSIKQQNAKIKKLNHDYFTEKQQKQNLQSELNTLKSTIQSTKLQYERALLSLKQKLTLDFNDKFSSQTVKLQTQKNLLFQQTKTQMQSFQHKIKQLETNHSQKIKELENKIHSLTQQKSELKKQLQTLEKQIQLLQQNIESLTESNQNLRTSLSEEQIEHQNQLNQKGAQNKKKNSGLKKSQKTVNKTKIDRKQITKQVSQVSKIQKKVKQSSKAQNPVIKKQKYENQTVKSQNRLEQQNKMLTSQIEQLICEVKKERQQIARLKDEKNEMMNRGLFQSSSILQFNDIQRKSHISQMLNKYTGLNAVQFKLLYRFNPQLKDNFHNYIDDKPNFLLLVKLVSGVLIGGFSPKALSQGHKQKNGLIFTINQKQSSCYYPRPQSKFSSMVYNEHYLEFGNGEIRIMMNESSVYSNFGVPTSHFDSKNDLPMYFLYGKRQNKQKINVQRKVQMIAYECYQVVFSK